MCYVLPRLLMWKFTDDKMNPQYGGPLEARAPLMPAYNQAPPSNSYNAFEMHGGPVMNKGYPPANYQTAGIQNGPSINFPGHMPNQSNSQVQSAAVPPDQMINNQNQNHPLLTGRQPPQKLPNNLSGPPLSHSPTPPLQQQQYWQQPSRGTPGPGGQLENIPDSCPPNANSVYQPNQHRGSSYSAPLTNTSFSSMPHGDRAVPPSDPANQMHSNRMSNPEMFQPPIQQQQFTSNRQQMPYTNGITGPVPPAPSSQYGHPNSSMHARYPPAPSPGPVQGSVHPSVSASQYNVQGSVHPSVSASQYNAQGNVHPSVPASQYNAQGSMHPSVPASQYNHQGNALSSQNRLGALPPPTTQNRRLDPDNMPSPIQVIEDDRKLRSCSFPTAQRGLVPPLVTTDFTVIDEGLCSPRFIRSTIYNVPTTAEMLKQTSVPFALAVSPFAQVHDGENPPPVVDPGEEGPVRCNRCRAYMSPFMQFIDAGRRFQCMLCKATSEVPMHYFTHLDHMGERVDKMERAELCLGSYEFIVNKDYCKEGKYPNCPAFIFVIDVSYNSIRSGMVKTLCDNMKSVLSGLPRDLSFSESKIRVGFVTYSSVIHFYNISENLAQPQMLVVSDVHDMFMPLLDGFLVNISKAEHVIDSLMEQIPLMFAETRETETVLGPAIQAGVEALRAAECAGKLFVFHSTLPIAEAPGKLKNRDDRKLLGTEKEKAVLTPQTTFYNNLGQDCVKAGCSVDLFLFNNAYIDVATLGQVCRLTGGQLYKYTYFQADLDGERFIEDLRRDVEKPIAFDAVLRVRTSTGVRPTDFVGSFFMSNTTDVELASINCDKSLNIEIKYDDKLNEDEGVCIQCAILYTSCSGQRRLRVHNLVLNTCTQMAELFRNCELDTIMNYFLKDGVRRITEETPKQVKEHFISCSAQILACYRKNCAQASSAGQLILPECMKLLPLYLNCLIKSDALAGGQEISTDDRSFIMFTALNMDVDSSAAYLYPRLIPLHDIKPNPEYVQIPTAIRCSIERIKEHGVYLLENGLNMFLWVGMNTDPEWIQDVFSVPTVARIDIDKNQLLQLNNPVSECVRAIINLIRNERQRYMKLCIVRQGDKMELMFKQLLVEDRTTEGSVSYVDFLCHLHKEIRTLLS
ncbi:protein transport protein Sec24C-like isoform X2 [Stegodyphus dumicola]|uniref:protein transport protein Sec24C-like isoform X2 n=1 Tax=Stegodyphus dumicola TaxID=202533 RepID=UPI0015AFD8D2|nr:protein transport protein Sec24C-like isoform X2 [Stegodyphus dumicola]